MSTVLVFGAFDGLHPGHTHFLAEAKTYGERLVVCLATDAAILRQKGHAPKHVYAAREAALRDVPSVHDVVAGDDTDGAYSAVVRLRPEVIAFGYDQTALREHLLEWLSKQGIGAITFIISAYQPEVYKSSLLNQ